MRKTMACKTMLVVMVLVLLVALPLVAACTKEVIKEVPVERVVEKEVLKEVPVEKVVEKEVLKEVPVEKVVVKEVPVIKASWNLACSSPSGQVYVGFFERFAGSVTKLTGGQLKITVRPAGELPYGAPDYLRLARDGVVEIADVAGVFHAGVEPAIALPDLPLALDYEELDTYREVVMPYVMKQLEDKWNVKVLTFYTMGPREVALKNRVSKMADLKGVTVRVAGGFEPTLMKSWGAVPVSVVWAEVYPALQRGVMEGVMTATLAVQEAKIYEVAPYLLKTDAHVVNFYLAVNRDSWNSLPGSIQEVVTKAAAEFHADFEKQVMHELEEAALKEMLSTGKLKEIIEVSRSERADFRAKSIPLLRDYIKDKITPEGNAVLEQVISALKIQ